MNCFRNFTHFQFKRFSYIDYFYYFFFIYKRFKLRRCNLFQLHSSFPKENTAKGMITERKERVNSFYRLFTNKSTAPFNNSSFSSDFDSSCIQVIKFVLTTTPIVRSIAERAAESCVTISLQSFPSSIIRKTPFICPSTRRRRFLTF